MGVLELFVKFVAVVAVLTLFLVIVGVGFAAIRRMGERHEEEQRAKAAQTATDDNGDHAIPVEPADDPAAVWQEDFGGSD